MTDKNIYLDHSATTPVDPRVFTAMTPYLTTVWGNASSVHSIGQAARAAVDTARADIARMLEVDSTEIVFTSGGTESDDFAIRGVAEFFGSGHIITTAIEHHAVLHAVEDLAKKGFEITILPVGESGLIDISELESAIRPDTILVSVMYANNEIGTVQEIARIGRLISKKREEGQKIYFHTDAVQAIGVLEPRPDYLKVDMMSVSGHKIYGPKGIGFLYIRKGTPVRPQLLGGAQEFGMRASTENVPGIVGIVTALRLAYFGDDEVTDDLMKYRNIENKKLVEMRDHLFERVLSEIPETYTNGDMTNRLPGNVNVSIARIEGESILLRLDFSGICASSGSACTSGSLDPSHVILAIGRDHALAHGSLRMTLGRSNTMEEIGQTVDTLKKIVSDLREISSR